MFWNFDDKEEMKRNVEFVKKIMFGEDDSLSLEFDNFKLFDFIRILEELFKEKYGYFDFVDNTIKMMKKVLGEYIMEYPIDKVFVIMNKKIIGFEFYNKDGIKIPDYLISLESLDRCNDIVVAFSSGKLKVKDDLSDIYMDVKRIDYDIIVSEQILNGGHSFYTQSIEVTFKGKFDTDFISLKDVKEIKRDLMIVDIEKVKGEVVSII